MAIPVPFTLDNTSLLLCWGKIIQQNYCKYINSYDFFVLLLSFLLYFSQILQVFCMKVKKKQSKKVWEPPRWAYMFPYPLIWCAFPSLFPRDKFYCSLKFFFKVPIDIIIPCSLLIQYNIPCSLKYMTMFTYSPKPHGGSQEWQVIECNWVSVNWTYTKLINKSR